MTQTRIVSDGVKKITADTIRATIARREKNTRIIVRDAKEAGLSLIVNATSTTWVYSYRPRGIDPATNKRWPNRTITLGNPASLNIDAARTMAAAMKGQAVVGDDPHAARKAKLAKAASDRAATVTRALDDYEKALPKRPKLRGTGLPTPRHVAEEIAHARAAALTMEIADTALTAIDAIHLRRLLTAEAARPATARARFGAFSRFMDWAQDEGLITLNPCLAIGRTRRPKPIAARAHCLGTDELASLWKAADHLDPLYRDLARFLISLPCRRGEAVHLDWAHLDLKAATWSQPGAMTKNGEPHRLHLHPLALNILADRHKEAKRPATGLVFPAPRSKTAIDTFSDIKAELEKHAGITGWRWHDFRRSFASVLGEAGLPEPVLDACLNHRQSATRGGVLGVYQRAQRWPEQVAALKAWGAALAAAVDGTEPASDAMQLPVAV